MAPKVAVIGAGLGGVATAVKLKQAGLHDFTVFEQSAGPGGTWYDNTYPGCEVDIHSHLYSFSFMPRDWTRTHARQPELQQYVEDTIDHFAIRNHFRFSTRVEGAIWDEGRQLYRLRLANGEEHEFNAVVSCLGLLSYPKYPDWPGREDFEGIQFHTARWEHEHDLAGKRIAVVGTGSTACQIVPELAKLASHLYVYQREPGWVYPKRERDFTLQERARYRSSRLVQQWERYRQFRDTTKRFKGSWQIGTRVNERMRQTSLAYIESEIEDPELRKLVTPTYPAGCKRPVYATSYLAALNRKNVTLVPHAVERATPTGIVSSEGIERELDVLILSTGFWTQRFLATIEVTGTGGHRLHDVWGDTPAAFLGITVPGFPNFYIVYGPNTNGGGSIIYQNERAIEMAVRMIKRLRRGATAVDTRRSQFDRYINWIDRQNAEKASAQFHCGNYFFSPSGRNVTQWPLTHLWYHALTVLWPLVGMVTHPKPVQSGGDPWPNVRRREEDVSGLAVRASH